MAWRREVTVRVAVYGTILIVLVTLAWLAMGNVSSFPMASNESCAIASLRAYLGGQGTFKRRRRYRGGDTVYANPFSGTGFPDLYCVGGPSGKSRGIDINLIDLALARATSPETPKAGYWLIDIIADKRTGFYDFTKECGLSAMPAVHGETGLHTFVIDIRGTVYKKDNGGKPVTVFPDVGKDGWLPVGS